MRRDVYTDEHESFRRLIRDYIERDVVTAFPEWERAGMVPKQLYRDLGALGVTGIAIPREYGGAGVVDFRYNAIVQEEMARALVMLGTIRTQLDIILPYFLAYANDEQRRRWLPGIADGSLATAIAMTEPGAGSDLAGISTRAKRHGDHYELNGAKTFITGGCLADLIIVVARTTDDDDDRRAGLTLLVVEDGMPGFTKGRRLDKLGLRVQDTAELSFSDVHVPVRNRLGEEGAAFSYLSQNLPQERLAIAVGAVAQATAALRITVDYVKTRTAFGRPLSRFQNTRFELAALATELEAAQALLDRAVLAHVNQQLDAAEAAKVKLFCTETQGRVTDRCLQLFGGYGYINDYPIARLYADARVTRILGGTSEIMKSIIAKSMLG